MAMGVGFGAVREAVCGRDDSYEVGGRCLEGGEGVQC